MTKLLHHDYFVITENNDKMICDAGLVYVDLDRLYFLTPNTYIYRQNPCLKLNADQFTNPKYQSFTIDLNGFDVSKIQKFIIGPKYVAILTGGEIYVRGSFQNIFFGQITRINFDHYIKNCIINKTYDVVHVIDIDYNWWIFHMTKYSDGQFYAQVTRRNINNILIQDIGFNFNTVLLSEAGILCNSPNHDQIWTPISHIPFTCIPQIGRYLVGINGIVYNYQNNHIIVYNNRYMTLQHIYTTQFELYFTTTGLFYRVNETYTEIDISDVRDIGWLDMFTAYITTYNGDIYVMSPVYGQGICINLVCTAVDFARPKPVKSAR